MVIRFAGACRASPILGFLRCRFPWPGQPVADQGVESLPGRGRGADFTLDELRDLRAGRLPGEIAGSVSLGGRGDDAPGQVGKERVIRVEVVGSVVVQVELPEARSLSRCLARRKSRMRAVRPSSISMRALRNASSGAAWRALIRASATPASARVRILIRS